MLLLLVLLDHTNDGRILWCRRDAQKLGDVGKHAGDHLGLESVLATVGADVNATLAPGEQMSLAADGHRAKVARLDVDNELVAEKVGRDLLEKVDALVLATMIIVKLFAMAKLAVQGRATRIHAANVVEHEHMLLAVRHLDNFTAVERLDRVEGHLDRLQLQRQVGDSDGRIVGANVHQLLGAKAQLIVIVQAPSVESAIFRQRIRTPVAGKDLFDAHLRALEEGNGLRLHEQLAFGLNRQQVVLIDATELAFRAFTKGVNLPIFGQYQKVMTPRGDVDRLRTVRQLHATRQLGCESIVAMLRIDQVVHKQANLVRFVSVRKQFD